jgi:cysteine-rich repeat protein
MVTSCVAVPNPAYSDDDSGMTDGPTSMSTGGSGPGSSGATNGSGGPADGEGSSTAGCGNGILEGDEECDDEDDDNTDGCLTNCTVPRSCLEIFELDPAALDGEYVIAPYGDRPPWSASCDMENDDHGGGWTALTLPDICAGRLDEVITPLEEAVVYERDSECRPLTQDAEGGHSYLWDIEFPPGFAELYLQDYAVRNNSVPGEPLDLFYSPTSWEVLTGFPNGSIGLGSASDPGPVARWIDDRGAGNIIGDGEVVSYPRLNEPYELVRGRSTTVRIGWGEIGQNSEGMYPWWEGSIFVR